MEKRKKDLPMTGRFDLLDCRRLLSCFIVRARIHNGKRSVTAIKARWTISRDFLRVFDEFRRMLYLLRELFNVRVLHRVTVTTVMIHFDNDC